MPALTPPVGRPGFGPFSGTTPSPAGEDPRMRFLRASMMKRGGNALAPLEYGNQNLPLMRMAKGGTVREGEEALVGEEGLEKVKVKKGKAKVTPIPGSEPFKLYPSENVSMPMGGAGIRPKYTTHHLNLGGRGTGEGERGGGVPSELLDPRDWFESIKDDMALEEQAIAEKRANEEAALGKVEEGMERVKGSREGAAQSREAMSRGIEERTRKSAEALTGGLKSMKEMPGKVARAGEEAVGQVGAAAAALTAAGEGFEERIGEASEEMRERGVEKAEGLFGDVVGRIETLRTEDLAAYRDETANTIQVQRQAIDSQFSQMEQEAMAELAGNPEAMALEKQRIKSLKSQAIGQLGAQVGMLENAAMADLRMKYAGLYTEGATKMASLVTDMTKALESAALSAKTAAGQASLAAQTAAMGAKATMSGEVLKARSWAEQNMAQLESAITTEMGNLFQNATRFELANEASHQQLQLAYQQVEMAGYSEMATFMKEMSVDYVPTSPYYAKVLQFWMEEDSRQRSLS